MSQVIVKPYHSVLVVQMKNWDPLVLGPALAIDKIPAGVVKTLKITTTQIYRSITIIMCTMLPSGGES